MSVATTHIYGPPVSYSRQVYAGQWSQQNVAVLLLGLLARPPTIKLATNLSSVLRRVESDGDEMNLIEANRSAAAVILFWFILCSSL